MRIYTKNDIYLCDILFPKMLRKKLLRWVVAFSAVVVVFNVVNAHVHSNLLFALQDVRLCTLSLCLLSLVAQKAACLPYVPPKKIGFDFHMYSIDSIRRKFAIFEEKL